MSKWINVKTKLPEHNSIVNIAGTTNGFKFVTICKIDREFYGNGKIWMDGVEFSGHEWGYDFEWNDVEYWQLAPEHPDL